MGTAMVIPGYIDNCTLCMGAWRNPLSLRCGHIYCSSCFEHYKSLHSPAQRLECPACFTPVHPQQPPHQNLEFTPSLIQDPNPGVFPGSRPSSSLDSRMPVSNRYAPVAGAPVSSTQGIFETKNPGIPQASGANSTMHNPSKRSSISSSQFNKKQKLYPRTSEDLTQCFAQKVTQGASATKIESSSEGGDVIDFRAIQGTGEAALGLAGPRSTAEARTMPSADQNRDFSGPHITGTGNVGSRPAAAIPYHTQAAGAPTPLDDNYEANGAEGAGPENPEGNANWGPVTENDDASITDLGFPMPLFPQMGTADIRACGDNYLITPNVNLAPSYRMSIQARTNILGQPLTPAMAGQTIRDVLTLDGWGTFGENCGEPLTAAQQAERNLAGPRLNISNPILNPYNKQDLHDLLESNSRELFVTNSDEDSDSLPGSS